MTKKLEGVYSLEKKWAVNTTEDGSEVINLEFAADKTVFSCDFCAFENKPANVNFNKHKGQSCFS